MPLDPAALRQLPTGSIRPAGWLERQLRLQADGLTGRLEEIWPDVGPDSAWLGGEGEDWERGPYYLDGMLPLAHVLQDETLLIRAKTWIEALLTSQRPDGQFGPTTNDDWWPRMVACKALVQHADATGDRRVLPFLLRYFAYQARELARRPLRSWGRSRGADAVLSVLWAYERTGDGKLIDLARAVLDQTEAWHAHLTHGLSPEPTRRFAQLDHGPNVAMGLKTSAVAGLVEAITDGRASVGADARARTAAELARLEGLHGQVHGVFSGDEWIAGRDPHHGVETCQVVEYMFTMEQLVRIYGDGAYADRLELAAFNLLPACTDPRIRARQYHQQANQIRSSVEQRDWTFSGDGANVFGLETNFGCCTANFHQGWPKFVAALWSGTPDGGLAVVSYAPCTVEAELPTGPVRFAVDSEYPFRDQARIELVDGHGEFPLRLRIPGWSGDAHIRVDGDEVAARPDGDGFVTIARAWSAGDVLDVDLAAAVRLVPRDRGALGARLGPVVLVSSPGEVWHEVPGAPGLAEWTVTPRSSWNFGLWPGGPGADGRPVAADRVDWPVRHRAVGVVPFALDAAPLTVTARGSRIPAWREDLGSAGRLPVSPVVSSLPVERLELVPYGSARLRIAEFPVVLPTFQPVD